MPTTSSWSGPPDPFQLFRIIYEVVRAGGLSEDAGVAFMLEQCHNIWPEDSRPDPIRDEQAGWGA